MHPLLVLFPRLVRLLQYSDSTITVQASSLPPPPGFLYFLLFLWLLFFRRRCLTPGGRRRHFRHLLRWCQWRCRCLGCGLCLRSLPPQWPSMISLASPSLLVEPPCHFCDLMGRSGDDVGNYYPHYYSSTFLYLYPIWGMEGLLIHWSHNLDIQAPWHTSVLRYKLLLRQFLCFELRA